MNAFAKMATTISIIKKYVNPVITVARLVQVVLQTNVLHVNLQIKGKN